MDVNGDNEPLLLTARDLARMIKISEREVWRMRDCGKLPAPIEFGPKMIRWSKEEINAWIEAGCPKRQSWDLIRQQQRRTRRK